MEDLVIPDVECENLIQLLENNSTKFPKSIADSFPNKMRVSYLHLKPVP